MHDDLRLARRAAAGKVDGRFVKTELCGRRKGLFPAFQQFFQLFAPAEFLFGKTVIGFCRRTHKVSAVAFQKRDGEFGTVFMRIRVVYDDEFALRFFRALFQLFGRDIRVHEIDRRAEFVRRIKGDERRRGIRHAQRKRIPFAEPVFFFQIFRKNVYQTKDLSERILFSVEGNGIFNI